MQSPAEWVFQPPDSPSPATTDEGFPEFVGILGPGLRQTGAVEPITGVGDITFDEVKPGMDGIAVAGAEVIHDIVGGLPSLFAAAKPEGA